MAYTTTLADLRTELVDSSELLSNFSTAQLNRLVNGGLAALWDYVAKHDAARLPLSNGNVSVVSGTESYSLPATTLRVVAVSVTDSSGANGFRELGRFNFREKYGLSITDASDKRASRYDVWGSNIYFSPTPTWTETVKVDFIAHFAELATDGATFETHNDWTEFAILYAQRKAAIRQEEDISGITAALNDAKERIKDGARIDVAHPIQRQDTVATPWPYGARRRRES